MTHVSRGEELGLIGKDIIHNPEDKSYKPFFTESPTRQIDFLSQSEVDKIIKFFHNNVNEHGVSMNNTRTRYSFIHNPQKFPEIHDIIGHKLKCMFPDGVHYTDVSTDNPPASSDFIMHQHHLFTAHTDSIIHVPNYVPYKDIIIPLAMEGDYAPFYSCNQRYYGRATSFRKDNFNDIVALYSNTVRVQDYKEYGVEHTTGELPYEFYSKYIHSDLFPISCWDGLSVEGLFDWIPGSAIIMDPSVLHGPTNYGHGGWKLGLTIRLLRYDAEYSPSTIFSRYKPETGFKRMS